MNPETISNRIHASIKPQLRKARSLEKHYEQAAHIEQLRRRYKMYDATDSQVQARAAQEQAKIVAEAIDWFTDNVIQPVWDSLRNVFATQPTTKETNNDR